MNIVTTDYSMQTKSYDIFFSGCAASPKCHGCHNQEAWDFNVGTDWKLHKDKISKDLNDFKSVIKWIFILGGDPIDQNVFDFTEFLIWINKHEIPLILFTRYELEQISSDMRKNFAHIKCGRYLPELTVDDNIQLGCIKLATSNQKIYTCGVDY